MATTFNSIRSQQMTLIEALTPSSLAGQKFRRHREATSFMEWVEANPAACFRRFEILRNWDDDQQPTSDGSLEGAAHSMELRVAYPLREKGLYGAENERDMDELIDQDRRLIDGAIGLNGGANYVANQHLCESTGHEVGAAGEGARVLSITFSLLYDRSV
jgi:hypothetical protein